MKSAGICTNLIFVEDFEVQLNDPCGRLACGAGWCRTRENSESLQDMEFWLVWRGNGWMRTQEREFVLLPGFCALMRPGGIYDAGHDEEHPLGITFIHFSVKHRTKRAPWPGWPEFFELADVEYLDAVSSRIVQLHLQDAPAAAALFRGLLLDLLWRPAWERPEEAGRLSVPHSREIAELAAAIRTGSPERVPSVREMARRLHLSAEHFSRLFRQVVGQSPMEMILDVRLSHARHLLRESSLGVGEIAERLGYRDVYFFSRQFRQKCGVSPMHFRQRRH